MNLFKYPWTILNRVLFHRKFHLELLVTMYILWYLPPSFMTYYQVCNLRNTVGATVGAGTAYPSGAHEFIPVFSVA